MRLDIPEMLIAFLLFAGVIWAVYNWKHPMAGPRH